MDYHIETAGNDLVRKSGQFAKSWRIILHGLPIRLRLIGPKTMKKTLSVKAIQKKSVPEIIIQELKSLMDNGELSPGDKLPPERELAKMLTVSRPSLREALRTLGLLGVLENKPGRGTFLKNSSIHWPTEPFFIISLEAGNFLHVFEARQAMEVVVADFASRRRDRDDIECMKNILKEMRASFDNIKKYTACEIQFHKAVTKSAKNPVIDNIMENIYQQLENARNIVYEFYHKNKSDKEPLATTHDGTVRWALLNPSFIKKDFLGHELIYKAIKAKNSDSAKKAMVEHMKLKYHFLKIQEGLPTEYGESIPKKNKD